MAKRAAMEALLKMVQNNEERYAKQADHAALAQKVETIITAGGEPNKIDAVKVNGVAQEITEKAVNITVPTKTSELDNDSKYQTEDQVNAKISSVYKPGGSVTFANLPTAAEEVLGMVYNVTDAFITTADFVEGAGGKHPAGTNVVVVSVDDAYKYDVLAGFVDLTGYVEKVEGKGLSSNDYTDEEKQKLSELQNYIHPEHTAYTTGMYKVTVDKYGHVVSATPVAKEDITALGIPAQDTTYDEITADEIDAEMKKIFGENVSA